MSDKTYLDYLVHSACHPPALPGEVSELIVRAMTAGEGGGARPGATELAPDLERWLVRHGGRSPGAGYRSSVTPDERRADWKTAGLAIAWALRDELGRELPGYGLGRGALLRHSLAAMRAFELATNGSGSEGLCRGLLSAVLHDVGMPLVERCIGTGFLRQVGRCHFVEAATFGIHHAWLGGLMARAWRLPTRVAAGIVYHHQPMSAPGKAARRLALFVALADHAAREVGCGDAQVDGRGTRSLLRQAGWSRRRFARLCSTTMGTTREVGEE